MYLPQSVPTDDTLNLNQITDQLDPNILHDGTISAIPTANKTLWMALDFYSNALPIFWDELDSIPGDCRNICRRNLVSVPVISYLAERTLRYILI